MNKQLLLTCSLLLITIIASCTRQENLDLLSPDGNLKLTFITGFDYQGKNQLAFSVSQGARAIISPSAFLILGKNIKEGEDYRIISFKRDSSRQKWINDFGPKKEIPDNYNSLIIELSGKNIRLNINCRAYNEGIAFSYEFPEQARLDSIVISDEWFIGGINGEQARTLNINFSFLDPGTKYSASVYSDDPVIKTRTHVRIDRVDEDAKTIYPAVLGSNKGFAMHIKPRL